MKAFDYIVVGAGSAGSVVAARLSEDPNVSVLLLEAGGRDTHPFMAMPAAFPKVAASRRYTWPFMTEPEPGLGGRSLAVWRGRTLGGCSSINAMINMRGNPADYDRLAAAGMTGWGFADVLPYFKKLEASWRGLDPYHGADGPVANVPVEHPDYYFAEFQQAAVNLGLPVCEDPHGADQFGISRMELTAGGGRRGSSARTYLAPAMKRTNLTVVTGALTTRVLLEGRRAIGVEYARGGTLQRVHAAREVVVSAGTYKTPQLLMLSGIGPADQLRSLGIEVVQDLPGLGENLQEHSNVLAIFRTKGKIGLTRHLRLDRAALAYLRWRLWGDGPFAAAGTSANLFLGSRPGLVRPDIQIIAMPVHQRADLWFPGLTKPPTFAFTARVGILHARSRGWVRLRSADPAEHPAIRFNMFSEPADVDAMIHAIRLTRELFAQEPLRSLVAEELLPGPELRSDVELTRAIRAQGDHRHHAVGTCRMGVDEGAVVDARLRVIGIDNLRIADVSVLPDDPSGNTNVPAMMIGEKAADLLKGDAKLEMAERPTR